ncbi:MAG: hypothetical protein CMJ18_06480 [Phycisphaeraceae bacterium]|nr:hypothetical protein [Phycisphaeraceae bacterium]
MSTRVRILYGRTGMTISVPDTVTILEGDSIEGLADSAAALRAALAEPIGAAPLPELLAHRRPASVAVTISDITRPVPNEVIVTGLMEQLHQAGISDEQAVVIIGTGMHRPSTPQERIELLGTELLGRLEVIDHLAEDATTLVQVRDDPPVSINRRFVEADFRIVTGLIEPHFMAGYSGGRKGVCPGLADAATVRRFHSFPIMADPRSTTGRLEGNPCHEESLRVAHTVGVDFLVNVAIDRQRRPAAFFCGDMEAAHLAGAERVGQWTSARVDAPYDLIITNGGGYPLDQTFYQTVKGMVTPLLAMHEQTIVLVASDCGEGIGSEPYTRTMLQWGRNWKGFLNHISSTDEVEKDQWQYQMHTRTLERIGVDRLRFVTDGLEPDLQSKLGVNPVLGQGDAAARCQVFVDTFAAENPDARIAVIPEGPYTMITEELRVGA